EVTMSQIGKEILRFIGDSNAISRDTGV
ncbi:hypothetical protein LCGC14_2473450, partial [marine sediment metagenome]